MVEAAPHVKGLMCLATMKGNRLGVLAYPDQAIAKICFSFQLVEIQSDQDSPKQEDRDQRASDRVEHKKQDQLPGDRPEHAAESKQL